MCNAFVFCLQKQDIFLEKAVLILILILIHSYVYIHIRDMFHVYFIRFEFHFLRLHINKTNKFVFFMHNGRVPGIAK